MIDREVRPRAEAIEHFAAVLRALRDSAGCPSFRKMSGRSHAISHTTLHEAAQGHRFPSWATTVEFVKACGADPAEYREQWERANREVRSASALPSTPELATSEFDGQRDEAEAAGTAASASSSRRWFRRLALGAVVVSTVMVGTVVADAVVSRGDGSHMGSGSSPGPSSSVQPLTAADCPVHQSNPPAAAPAHPGDASAFIADILLPDCTHVPRGSTVAKVWRFKNAGTVPWRGYVLHRVDLPQRRDQCQTIADVPVKDTEPGKMVDIRVMVTAPDNPGFCFVRFKLEDAAGRIAFPGSRPVNFQLIID